MLDLTRQALDDWWKSQGNDRIYRLSASSLGDDCQRRLWYKMNGAPSEQFDGRMKRLFDRGHKEEDRFIAALRGIGVDVADQQKQVFYKGKVFGHIDGIGTGFPEAPKTPHLLEFKTMNDKNFKLLKKGLPKKHVIQMQVYMGLLHDIKRAMYLVVNKNDDEIFQARIEFDPEFFKAQMQKVDRLMELKTPPQRIDDRPEFYLCKMCYLREICHEIQ